MNGMVAVLAPVDQPVGLPGRLLERAYVLPPGLSYERWASIGASLQQIRDSINFWLGDWLIYGEQHFGEDAYQAVRDDVKTIYGRGDESIDQMMLVARNYPPDTRVSELKWSHHREALRRNLPVHESVALLHEAVRERLPSREVARRADERAGAIAGRAVAADGTPVETDDLEWCPTRHDLTDECRARLEIRLSEMSSRLRVGYEAGWLQGHLEANALSCFKREGP